MSHPGYFGGVVGPLVTGEVVGPLVGDDVVGGLIEVEQAPAVARQTPCREGLPLLGKQPSLD